MSVKGRHGSRRLLVQALYQHQLGGHDCDQLSAQFSEHEHFGRVDGAYFLSLLPAIMEQLDELDALIAVSADRPVEQLDPVERAILWLGVAELKDEPDVPVKVVINEAIELTKQYGAQDGHRYINAVLDKAAASLR